MVSPRRPQRSRMPASPGALRLLQGRWPDAARWNARPQAVPGGDGGAAVNHLDGGHSAASPRGSGGTSGVRLIPLLGAGWRWTGPGKAPLASTLNAISGGHAEVTVRAEGQRRQSCVSFQGPAPSRPPRGEGGPAPQHPMEGPRTPPSEIGPDQTSIHKSYICKGSLWGTLE